MDPTVLMPKEFAEHGEPGIATAWRGCGLAHLVAVVNRGGVQEASDRKGRSHPMLRSGSPRSRSTPHSISCTGQRRTLLPEPSVRTRRGHMIKVVQFASVAMTGLLAGNEVGTLIGFHPALQALPLRAQIESEQALNGRLVKIMPTYMTATVLAATAAALDRRGERSFPLAAGAAGASALVLGITLVGNVPLNERTVSYPSDGDEAGWTAIRRRWERLHAARVCLDVAAFAALTTAALTDR